MAPHSSTLAWKIPWMEKPGRLQSMGSLRVGHNWATSLWLFTSCIGEGNGNPLQCSCLENPRDGGAWWAAIYGVTQSWTWLKWLSSSSSILILLIQSSSVAQSCTNLFYPMDCSMPGFPVHSQFLELAQTHVHRVGDAIQPSHPLSSPSSSCLQSFPASGSFPMSQFFTSDGKNIGVSASTVLPMNIQG